MSWLKKSFHVQMKVKMAVVASAGMQSGMITRQYVPKYPHPSISAASSSSTGRLRMNWTIRKMKNASVAKNLGTMSGRNVLIQPSSLNRMYWGTITTWIGSMIVPSMMAKQTRLNGNSNRANA
jgi:hypothetical protein